MYIRLYLVTLCLAFSAFSSPVKRDGASTVESDITNIDAGTKSLNASINAFPISGGTLAQALNIHEAAVSLEGTVNSATSDADASAAFTETEGNTILGLVKTLVPDIQQTLTNLVAKKTPLEDLPVSGAVELVLEDLQTLKSDSDAFISALIAKTPSDLLSAAQAQATLVDNAFNSAIAAYSS